MRPHNPATGFRLSLATVVSAEPFSHGTGTLWCLQKEMATYRHWLVSLWRDPDDVSHCRILSLDKTEWRLISATLCRWRHCFVTDQLWLMARIWEEEYNWLIIVHSVIALAKFLGDTFLACSVYHMYVYRGSDCVWYGWRRYILFTLHSQMQSTDQRRVFQNAGPGVRKIVSILPMCSTVCHACTFVSFICLFISHWHRNDERL